MKKSRYTEEEIAFALKQAETLRRLPMAIPAHNVLKTALFITCFVIISWLDVRYFYEHPLISNATSIKIAKLIHSNPKPEDIYYIYDYVVILLNLALTFLLYKISIKTFISLRR